MKALTVRPLPEAAQGAARFVEETLAADGCPAKVLMKMNIAFDELFSNIVRYSGASEATVSCGVQGGEAVLSLSDDGLAYDPTRRGAPDITLPAEARGIGGMGVHLVKKLMDSVQYQRSGGKNILVVRKRIAPQSEPDPANG